MSHALSAELPGTWRLVSRVDRAASGDVRVDPALGADPVALLIYDRGGNFAAQFMKRDRSGPPVEGHAAASNNTQAQGGYDAYFGTYTVDDATSVVTQRLAGALSAQHVGAVLSRPMHVVNGRLVIVVETTAVDGTAVTRTLTWERVA
ncbi:MAG: lipocalin-like domain-containing protein [Gemmatimonadota bacterium]|nr:lipocalin-like domain-containing protein [Gemmatimonadota bacterium]